MKRAALFLALFFWAYQISLGQTDIADRAVLVSATAQANPNQIILEWEPYNLTETDMRIYRQEGENVFESNQSPPPYYGITAHPGTTFIDTNVVPGQVYEYLVWDDSQVPGSIERSGYLTSGIEVNESSDRGILLLVYDTTYLDHFQTEFNQYKLDLIGDGYRVKEIPVDRNDTVPHIKDLIVQAYLEDTINTRSLFLFGHVPVPYSGIHHLDGHSDHTGAWPADTYYADIDGLWTDTYINYVNTNFSWCTNLPEDGKFDQNTIPSLVELEMGRVDFHALPLFSESEAELLRLYLIKDHQYKHGIITQPQRALIDHQAFGSDNTWTNLATLVNPDSIVEEPYLTMINDGYIISDASSYGTWWSMAGILDQWNYDVHDIQTIFTFSFGSYFGDWDSWNGLLRSALASGTILTNVWSRPGWKTNSMSMGKSIGYCAKRSMNARSYGPYVSSIHLRSRSMALMGDPTLRMHILKPPSDLIATEMSDEVELVWQASPDNVLGYDIYRKEINDELYTQVNQAPVNALNYTDQTLTENGDFAYMVRAVRLETTQTGSFYNRSQSVFDTATVTSIGVVSMEEIRSLAIEVYPNPSSERLNVAATLPQSGVANFEIYDQFGKMVMSASDNQFTTGHSVALDISKLKSGVYSVAVISDSGTSSSKFLKLN